MLNLVAQAIGYVVILVLILIAAASRIRALLCWGGMHDWEHVVDWGTGRLVEKQCFWCAVRVEAFKCWRCGTAWRSHLFAPGPCEVAALHEEVRRG